ncbi:helix-turn-helix domain-containing protein [Secundilactobacillus kimchicus]|uniref:helix-turn-helix domain-containing protein n=1 Tax=Secundilactobacillus kimchicus TaxID=528209 RepID=UPI0024A8B749|nr:transcriptional regulator [Secundilactobacillus kimchicus]
MPEEKIASEVKSITIAIKTALIQRDMKQVELATMLDVAPQVLNRAIHGDMSPQSVRLRRKIYQILGIE